MKDKKCEFEHEGKDSCCEKVVGIARCKYLCRIHFNTIRKDNLRRFRKSQLIPKELKFTKKLFRSDIAPHLLKDSKIIKEVKK